MSPLRVCLLGQAHTRERRAWNTPINDSREWMRVLGGGDVLSYQTVIQRPEMVSIYDVAMIELTPATHRLPALLKRYVPGLACLGLIEGRVEYVVRSRNEMESLFEFCRSVDASDVLGVLVERTVPYYRLYAADPRRVQWLGVPYPLDWTESIVAKGLPERKLVIELGSAMDSRNGIANLLVLRELQRRYPAVVGRIYYFLEREVDMVRALGIRAEFRRPEPWPQYYRRHLDAFAVLCLDDRRTWGRYALDAASARMPFIGSHLSHCGERVAEMTMDPFDTDRAVSSLAQLIEERLAGRNELYQDIVNTQLARLAEYGPAAALQRFLHAIADAGLESLAVRGGLTAAPAVG